MHSYIFLKMGRGDKTLSFSPRKQAKCTYKNTVARVFLLFSSCVTLFYTSLILFLRAQLNLDVFLPARFVRELFLMAYTLYFFSF